MSGAAAVQPATTASVDDPGQVAAPVQAAETEERSYVAMVVFHGMGQQRHYEMVAEVVEAIDAHVHHQHRIDPANFRSPRLERKIKRETHRGGAQAGGQDDQGSGTDHVYVQTDYPVDGRKARVRFYEGYWAPAAAAGTGAVSVLTWLLAQIPRPFTVLRAPWRAFGRLRRADLLRMAFEQPQPDPDRLPKEWSTLADLYAAFSRRRPPESGDFADFLAYVRSALDDDGERNRTLALVHRWHHRHLLRQWRSAALLLGIGLTAAASVAILATIVLGLLQDATQWFDGMPVASWVKVVTGELKADFSTTASIVTLLLTGAGVGAFLRDSVGDVQQFVTYDQAQALHAQREKILAHGERTLRQVLADPACERVVIVAHSLGTAVALDTILRLRAANEAQAPLADDAARMLGPLPLDRIQHFITCGSPIDKINYFFATLRSRFRSYETMFDALRGDIGNIPFSRSGRQPYIHWVNFWDRGDPISGPLHTVASSSVVRVQRVDNVRIASLPWPDPAASHGAYFSHRQVIAFLFGAAFRNEASFASPPKDPAARDPDRAPPLYRWQGPGKGSRLQSALLMLLPACATVLVWTALGLFLPRLPAPSLGHAGIALGLLIAGAAAQRAGKAAHGIGDN